MGNAFSASAATSSGALTPQPPTHKTITGTSGSKEKLDPSELSSLL